MSPSKIGLYRYTVHSNMASAAFDAKGGTLMECTVSASNVPGFSNVCDWVFCIYSASNDLVMIL
jgi:hypothetical protein